MKSWKEMGLVLGAALAISGCTDDDPMSTDDSGGSGSDTSQPDPDASGDAGSPTPPGSTSNLTDPTTGEDETGPGEDTTSGTTCEVGVTMPDEVVMIGDSYLAITTVPTELFVHARLNGSLGPDETWRRYDQGGTQMGNGQIPGQFQAAVNEDPVISTVVMTGGGNDVLIGDANGCLQNPPPEDAACVAAIDVVFAAAEQLMMDMADAGVEKVVYFFYPHLPEWGFISGAKREVLDYAYPLAQALCESAPMDCIFVDTRDAFAGHEDEYFMVDGIHPNAAGSAVIGELVWDAMLDNCVAQ